MAAEPLEPDAPQPRTLAGSMRSAELGTVFRVSDDYDGPRAGQIGQLNSRRAGFGTLTFLDGGVEEFPAARLEHPEFSRPTDFE